MTNGNITTALLDHYHENGRELPWRKGAKARQKGERPLPYHVWLSEIMLQQTTVAAVIPYFEKFTQYWPDIAAFAAADDSDILAAWAGLGYYARARNMIKCARVIVSDYQGKFPKSEGELRQLPGIGDYTAAAIASFAFGQRALVMDANILRVVARLFAIDTPLPKGKSKIAKALDGILPQDHHAEMSEALMDLGATLCKARQSQCDICPLSPYCKARQQGNMLSLPVKKPKKPPSQRNGTAWIITNDADEILLVTRPDNVMLGGMRALPDNGWSAQENGKGKEPLKGEWQILDKSISHIFTHCHLNMSIAIYRGDTAKAENLHRQWHNEKQATWWPLSDIANAGLPGLYRKIVSILLKSGAIHDGLKS